MCTDKGRRNTNEKTNRDTKSYIRLLSTNRNDDACICKNVNVILKGGENMDTQSLQEKYDELADIIDTIDMLTNHLVHYKDLAEDLDYVKIDAQREMNEIEPLLHKAYNEEEKAQEREYWASQF